MPGSEMCCERDTKWGCRETKTLVRLEVNWEGLSVPGSASYTHTSGQYSTGGRTASAKAQCSLMQPVSAQDATTVAADTKPLPCPHSVHCIVLTMCFRRESCDMEEIGVDFLGVVPAE